MMLDIVWMPVPGGLLTPVWRGWLSTALALWVQRFLKGGRAGARSQHGVAGRSESC
jgi:hypothetical protein